MTLPPLTAAMEAVRNCERNPADALLFMAASGTAYQFIRDHGKVLVEALETLETLPCGHPKSLLVVSAETGLPLYCDLCDCRSARRDAEACEAEFRSKTAQLTKAARQLLAEIDAEVANREGENWLVSSGCYECTEGCVPDHLKKGPCGYHALRSAISTAQRAQGGE